MLEQLTQGLVTWQGAQLPQTPVATSAASELWPNPVLKHCKGPESRCICNKIAMEKSNLNKHSSKGDAMVAVLKILLVNIWTDLRANCDCEFRPK